MKQIILLLTLFMLTNCVAKLNINNAINSLEDEIFNFHSIPDHVSFEDVKKIVHDRYVFKITHDDLSDLAELNAFDQSDRLAEIISSKDPITVPKLKRLLTIDDTFLIEPYSPTLNFLISYKKLMLNEEIIGESWFETQHGWLTVDPEFCFKAKIVADQRIYTISLSYFDNNYSFPRKYKNLYTRTGKDAFSWVNFDSVQTLYIEMQEDESTVIPQELIQLRIYWERILNNLEIKTMDYDTTNY